MADIERCGGGERVGCKMSNSQGDKVCDTEAPQ